MRSASVLTAFLVLAFTPPQFLPAMSSASAKQDAPVAADCDQSGAVNAVDVQLVINGALGMPGVHPTDVDYSTATDAIDVQLVINAALGMLIDGDSDGLCDGAEANLGTNPSVWDTDLDGVCDGREVLDGTDPLTGAIPLAVELSVSPGTVPTDYDVLCDAVTGHPIPALLTFTWDFGDGTVLEGADRVTHRYDTAGSYTVKVTVSNTTESVDDTAGVTIDDTMPTASENLGTGGGSVQLGRCTVTLGAGQTPQIVPFEVTELPTLVLPAAKQLDFEPIGPAFRVETPLMTADPFTVTLTYEDSEISAGYSAANLGILLRLIAMPQMGVDSDPADTASPIEHHVPVPATVDTTAHTVTFETHQGGVFQLVAMSGPLDVESVIIPGTKGGVTAKFTLQFDTTPTLGKTAYRAALFESMGLSVAKYGVTWNLPIIQGTVKVVIGDTEDSLGYVFADDPHTVYLKAAMATEKDVKTTFAHEYFHTIQHYASNKACVKANFNADAWFFEGTASWAQDEVYDSATDHYWVPNQNRLFVPMNFDKYDGVTEYKSIIFWKWVETVSPGVVANMIYDHQTATHSAVSGGNLVQNSTAVTWQDSLLTVYSAVDFTDFAVDALYRKNFETDETGDGNLWQFLGPVNANDLPQWFSSQRTTAISPGQPGSSETNKKTVQFNLKQHLTVDARYIVPDNTGPYGRLHVEFPQTKAGRPLDAVVISNGESGPEALTKLQDLSAAEKEAVVPFYESNEAIVIITDPRWQQDPSDTPIQVDVKVWVEDPCGQLPAIVYDVSDEAGLAGALNSVPSGGTIRLAAGTYTMNTLRLWPRLWNLDANVGIDGQKLVGAGKDTTTIVCRNDSTSIFARGHVVLRNLTLNLDPGSGGLGILAGDIDSLILCNVDVVFGSRGYFLSFEEWYPPKSSQLAFFDCDISSSGASDGVLFLTVDTASYCSVKIKNTTMTGWEYAFTYANGGTLGCISADIDCAGFSNNDNNVLVGACYFQDGRNYCNYTEQCPTTRAAPVPETRDCGCGK